MSCWSRFGECASAIGCRYAKPPSVPACPAIPSSAGCARRGETEATDAGPRFQDRPISGVTRSVAADRQSSPQARAPYGEGIVRASIDPDPGFFTRKPTCIAFRRVATPAYLAATSTPATLADLSGRDFPSCMDVLVRSLFARFTAAGNLSPRRCVRSSTASRATTRCAWKHAMKRRSSLSAGWSASPVSPIT